MRLSSSIMFRERDTWVLPHNALHVDARCLHVRASHCNQDLSDTSELAAICADSCSRYVDALVLVGFFAPCGVAKAGVATLPMIGAITRGLQFLFVTRSGTTGKTSASLRCANCHTQHVLRCCSTEQLLKCAGFCLQTR